MSRFSNKAYLQEMAAQLQPELAFPIGRPEEWPRWRHALHATVAELLGGLSPPRAEPEARVLERRHDDGYVRERIAMRSREGVVVPAYLLTPVDERGDGGKRRAVLCLHGQHGHGHGKDDVVGDPGAPRDIAAGQTAFNREPNRRALLGTRPRRVRAARSRPSTAMVKRRLYCQGHRW